MLSLKDFNLDERWTIPIENHDKEQEIRITSNLIKELTPLLIGDITHQQQDATSTNSTSPIIKNKAIIKFEMTIKSFVSCISMWLVGHSDEDIVLATKTLLYFTLLDDYQENTGIDISNRVYNILLYQKLVHDDVHPAIGAEIGLLELIKEVQSSGKSKECINYWIKELLFFIDSIRPFNKLTSKSTQKIDIDIYLYIRKVNIGIGLLLATNHLIINRYDVTSKLINDIIWVKIEETASILVIGMNDALSYAKEKGELDGARNNPLTFLQADDDGDNEQQRLSEAFKKLVNISQKNQKDYFKWIGIFKEQRCPLDDGGVGQEDQDKIVIDKLLKNIDQLIHAMYIWGLNSPRYRHPDSPFIENRTT